MGNVKKSVAERTRHQRQYERRVNKRQMQTQESKIDTGKALDADLVDTESIRTDSTGHRFSPYKTSAVYEKTSPKSDLRWKPTGRILKSVGLRWNPTGKLFNSCTSKVDNEPPHGSNVDILNMHECKQTLDVSTGTSINVQKEQSLDLSAANGMKPCQGDSLNLPDHMYSIYTIKWETGAQVDQGSQIKMIQVKEMMQDNDLKNSKSKDKGSKSRSQSMDEQSHYKQDKTITRQSINVKRHIFNVIGGTEEFEERDLNIGGDC
ncbi:hypothetical protein Tco_0757424 [Tanacetum coccineum]